MWLAALLKGEDVTELLFWTEALVVALNTYGAKHIPACICLRQPWSLLHTSMVKLPVTN